MSPASFVAVSTSLTRCHRRADSRHAFDHREQHRVQDRRAPYVIFAPDLLTLTLTIMRPLQSARRSPWSEREHLRIRLVAQGANHHLFYSALGDDDQALGRLTPEDFGFLFSASSSIATIASELTTSL